MPEPPGFLTRERRQFVEALAARRVRFLVVGGEAIRATGFQRLTKDLDIVVPRDAETIGIIKDVALGFGYRIPRPTDLLVSSPRFKAMYLRLAPRERDTEEITHHVDVMFADAYVPDFDRALAEGIELPRGSGIRYAGVSLLLEMKRRAVAAPRRSPQSLAKDERDIAHLENVSRHVREEAAKYLPGGRGGEGNIP